MRQKALRPLRVEIPKSDDPPTGTVLVVGVVAFVIGIAWPRFAGIQLGPSAPSTGVSSPAGSAVESVEPPKLSTPTKAEAAPHGHTGAKIATSPRTRKMTADTPCTTRMGTRRVMRSPSQTTGALASIMPSVVPATTHR